MEEQNKLKQIRENANGLEADESLLRQYPVMQEKELWIPTRHGQIHVWLVRAEEQSAGLLPVDINLHGGGFVKGYRGQDVVYARILANKGKCLVFDVDYKTAPEYRYPYSVEETFDLVCYLQDHAGEYGGDSDRIVLSGQSAGANIAAAVTMILKKTGKKLPRKVICSYPPCDFVTDPADKDDMGEGADRISILRQYNDWYVSLERRGESYVSLNCATAEELEGLPPFVVITAERDMLEPEGRQFALNLMDAGVCVTAKKVMGAKHGFVVRRSKGCEEADQVIFEAMSVN